MHDPRSGYDCAKVSKQTTSSVTLLCSTSFSACLLRQVFACGDRHEGEYHEDKRHGYGCYTWDSGDRYEGYWGEGRMSGKGVKYMANGDVYDGE